MSAIWVAVLGCGLGCYLLKLAGVSLPERLLEHPVTRRVADLIPVALLAGLVAVQAFATGTREGQHLALDARSVGLAVAFVALLLRAPFLVVVILAATTAALVRLV